MNHPKTPGKPASRTPYRTPRKTPFHNRPREPVQVFCRLRPLKGTENGPCARVTNGKEIVISPPECSLQYQSGRKAQTKHVFHRAFGPCSRQREIFDEIALPLVEDLLHCKNGLLFAYGITGSGKTYTMAGENDDPGILPRCLDVIFNSIKKLQARKYTFTPNRFNAFNINNEIEAERERRLHMPPRGGKAKLEEPNFTDTVRLPHSFIVDSVEQDFAYGVVVSYVEIFNDYIFDLLEEAKQDRDVNPKAPQSKKLREDVVHHQMYVQDVTEVPVSTTEEAYELLLKGQRRRRVAHTQLNQESSRSHSIFNIRLVRVPLDENGRDLLRNSDYLNISQLSLVDLAGSERAIRTQSSGDRLREAGNINQSLMALRNCLEILRDNQNKPFDQQKIVPYRESRLTQVFKNFFEGDGKVRMIICCSPRNEDFDEMLHVMRFAEISQEVTVARSEAPKADITGLLPGRRKMNEKLEEAFAAQKSAVPSAPPQLPFDVEVVEAPTGMLSSFNAFIAGLERQASDMETGCRFVAKGLDLFKETVVKTATVTTRDIERYRLEVATLQERLAVADVANLRAVELQQELQLAHQEVDEVRAAWAAAVQEKDAMENAHYREVEQLQQHVAFLRDENDVLSRATAESEEENRHLMSDNKQKEQKLTLLQHIVQGEKSSTPDGKKNGKENTIRNVPALRSRKRQSPDKWLEHKPSTNLDTDAILQPAVKKKKVVTMPKKKDFGRECDRYMLHHQVEDSIGEVQEHLFKGDVMKTRTGGMSIQFTDVETLQQRRPDQLRNAVTNSPGDQPYLNVDKSPHDVDVRGRCSIGIEGRPNNVEPSIHHRAVKK